MGILQIGENRLVIGLVKRVHVREELIDRATLRIRGERFHVIGRMASPNRYCRMVGRLNRLPAETQTAVGRYKGSTSTECSKSTEPDSGKVTLPF